MPGRPREGPGTPAARAGDLDVPLVARGARLGGAARALAVASAVGMQIRVVHVLDAQARVRPGGARVSHGQHFPVAGVARGKWLEVEKAAGPLTDAAAAGLPAARERVGEGQEGHEQRQHRRCASLDGHRAALRVRRVWRTTVDQGRCRSPEGIVRFLEQTSKSSPKDSLGSIVRRRMDRPHGMALYFGPYRLDGPEGLLWHDDRVVPLPPKATAIRGASRGGRAARTKAALLDAAWNGIAVTEAALTVTIRTLRKALADDPLHPRYVETMHRRGYRFVAPVDRGSKRGRSRRERVRRSCRYRRPCAWAARPSSHDYFRPSSRQGTDTGRPSS